MPIRCLTPACLVIRLTSKCTSGHTRGELANANYDLADVYRLRDIARRLPGYLGEEASKHPEYETGSAASVMASDTAKSIRDKIDYAPEDDNAIDKWVRTTLKTTWHSMATCPMKAKEDDGVVDERLNVYGVKRLKLAGT